MKCIFLLVSMVVVCFCVWGCGDGHVHTTDVLGILSGPEAEVTELTPEVWEMVLSIHDTGPARYDHDPDVHASWVEKIREAQKVYYTKYIDAGGIAIIGNDLTEDVHFIEARRAVMVMTSKRPEIRDKLAVDKNFYMILFGPGTHPQYGPEFWNAWGIPSCRTGSGYGAKGVKGYCWAPVDISAMDVETYMRWKPDGPDPSELEFYRCIKDFGWKPGNTGPSDAEFSPGTEDVCYILMPEMKNKYEAYLGIFVHEFAHAFHQAIRSLDAGFDERLEEAYYRARELGTWEGFYANVSWWEYFAVGAELWFYGTTGSQTDVPRSPDYSFNITREELKERDPLLYELLDEWYPAVSLPLKYEGI
ncbi:MAG: hypothetical protein OXU23_20930 [Candidatus Poribacteria bacterium]|nr:hypothetical protein [Candidatus Poribacteria bacterium]